MRMPVKLGKKKYETFSGASAAVQKKKGISKKRANAYVAAIERKQGIEPRTGKRSKAKTSSRQKGKTITKKTITR
ncbi:hypothetical protein DYY65_07300 [Nitrososphaera sp. AFS]|nr:hypothetical protein [Nitrososphaera sp. AFS]